MLVTGQPLDWETGRAWKAEPSGCGRNFGRVLWTGILGVPRGQPLGMVRDFGVGAEHSVTEHSATLSILSLRLAVLGKDFVGFLLVTSL